jgi:PAS domain S-box-containing protein
MSKSHNQLKKENETLLLRLAEAEETLDAIRNGEVDAIVMNGSAGEKIFSLSSAETPYRIIIEKMNEGAVIISSEGLIVYCNQRFADMFGEAMEQITGSDFLRFILPGELPEYTSILKNGVNKRFSKEIKYTSHGKDASWFRLSFSPLPPEIMGDTCVMVTDITELKEKENKMERLNNRLLLATASSGLGIWDWDINNDILTWDDGMFKLYGIEKSGFSSVYDAWVSKLHPEDKLKIDQDIQSAISGSKEYNTEFRIIAGDLSVHYIRATAIFEYDNEGKATRMIGVNWDITESKKAEAEIKLLNEELEKKIIERTRQLENSNKELESFSYSVAHDLRAPLRAVNSYAQILKEDYEQYIDADGKQVLKNIHNNATKMGALIDELLTFSRLGRKEIHKTTIDMNTMLQSIVDDFKQTTQVQAAIHIGSMPVVQADYTLLHQVLVNLLSNAIKYSAKKEHPVVEIFTEQQDGKTVFVIKDNGAGFDMQFADKLFGVFQRLHSEKEFEGNGVGLAIVHRIISKHGGRVWAEGKENMGATFYFTLN